MASASVMTGLVRDRTLDEASQLVSEFTQLVRDPSGSESADVAADQQAILSVVRASPSRGNCAVLAWHTLGAALRGEESTTLQPDGEPLAE